MTSDRKPGSLLRDEDSRSIAHRAIRVRILAEAFCIIKSEVISLTILAYGDLWMPC